MSEHRSDDRIWVEAVDRYVAGECAASGPALRPTAVRAGERRWCWRVDHVAGRDRAPRAACCAKGKRNPSSGAASPGDRDDLLDEDVRDAPVEHPRRQRRRSDLRLPLEPGPRGVHPGQQPEERDARSSSRPTATRAASSRRRTRYRAAVRHQRDRSRGGAERRPGRLAERGEDRLPRQGADGLDPDPEARRPGADRAPARPGPTWTCAPRRRCPTPMIHVSWNQRPGQRAVLPAGQRPRPGRLVLAAWARTTTRRRARSPTRPRRARTCRSRSCPTGATARRHGRLRVLRHGACRVRPRLTQFRRRVGGRARTALPP